MNQPDEQPPPNERKLRIASFATHAARGLLRDRQMRRHAEELRKQAEEGGGA